MQNKTTLLDTEPVGVLKDVATIVNENIIEQLYCNVVPWRVSWAKAGIPTSLISRRPYRGINLVLLASLKYENNYFLTLKQLSGLGGKLLEGEHGHMIISWNMPDETAPGPKKKATMQYHLVYNIAQCQGIPGEYIQPPNKVPFDLSIDDIIKNMPKRPEIRHKDKKMFYNPLQDFINIPKALTFESADVYVAALLHEILHSTGHFSRIGRPGLIEMVEYGWDMYSHEELVAEMGMFYLLSFIGITPEFKHGTENFSGWIDKFSNDRYLIFSAAKQAQKAVDYILNIKAETEDKVEEE